MLDTPWVAWCFCSDSFIMLSGEGSGTHSTRLENPMDGGAWWAAVSGVAGSRTRLSDFTFTFHCHALEKEMATHSSVLAWRIPGTGAWWAAVYGVAQSRTRLTRLSSSSSCQSDLVWCSVSFCPTGERHGLTESQTSFQQSGFFRNKWRKVSPLNMCACTCLLCSLKLLCFSRSISYGLYVYIYMLYITITRCYI